MKGEGEMNTEETTKEGREEGDSADKKQGMRMEKRTQQGRREGDSRKEVAAEVAEQETGGTRTDLASRTDHSIPWNTKWRNSPEDRKGSPQTYPRERNN